MTKKPRKPREQAPTVRDVEEVVEAKRQDFVERLAAFRAELEQLIQLMGSHAVDSEISQEIHALALLAGLENGSDNKDLSDARITSDEKIEFIVSELERNGGEMEKTILLELARKKFGQDRPASFLDPALRDGPFDLSKSKEKGNQKTVYLVKQP